MPGVHSVISLLVFIFSTLSLLSILLNMEYQVLTPTTNHQLPKVWNYIIYFVTKFCIVSVMQLKLRLDIYLIKVYLEHCTPLSIFYPCPFHICQSLNPTIFKDFFTSWFNLNGACIEKKIETLMRIEGGRGQTTATLLLNIVMM